MCIGRISQLLPAASNISFGFRGLTCSIELGIAEATTSASASRSGSGAVASASAVASSVLPVPVFTSGADKKTVGAVMLAAVAALMALVAV
jgi:hypothetical protein